MFIQQIYTNCLAQASYYIEDNGEAAIIDPMREAEPYIKLAQQRNAHIKFIFETHFHADFVSGHLDLNRLTAAPIVFGPEATPGYHSVVGKHNQEFKIGNCIIKLLHTPGHTIESCCYLLLDESNKPHALFSGDTLFIGDVGRPDLGSNNLSKEELASKLFDSINNIIKKISPSVLLYPGHGAGSACGKMLGVEKFSTLEEQLKTNYALQALSREKFIELVTSNIPLPPAYFFRDAAINKNGYTELSTILQNNAHGISLNIFKQKLEAGSTILDTRNAKEFSLGHIPGSVNIGLEGEFAPWVGAILPMETSLLLICKPGTETEAVKRLARIGYENVMGFLSGGFEHWKNAGLPQESIENIDATDFYFYNDISEYTTVDVRRFNEAVIDPLPHSILVPLEEMKSRLSEFEKDKKYIVCCKGGYRSMIAASLLKANGITNLMNVTGGVQSLKEHMMNTVTR